MFYNCNDYLVPVLVGNTKEINRYAAAILKRKKARPHIFGDSFSLFQSFRYSCHKIIPKGDFWLFSALCDFAGALDEYYTPAMILCDDAGRQLCLKYRDELEKHFVIIDFDEYVSTQGEQDE